jgi:hypothetical protein
MERPIRLRTVAVLSIVFTYFFFIEYLPPFSRVHVPYDLEGYHFSLVDFAFQSLREGRFPEWDWAQYSGISFVGNTQAALFYPPMWLVLAANVGRKSLSYQSLQSMVFAHVWLAFFLCYRWLRYKRLGELASAMGAGVFAYSGYMLLQLQHFGLVAGCAWMPLGLWGIDQTIEERRWQPLWKVVAASALCFLAGYPPTWFVFAVCMVSYAAWRWKAAAGTILALGASLAIAMIQILPTLEALSLKAPEIKYGSGIRALDFYISYLVPNYFNFGLHVPAGTNPGREYLYLGAPAIFGLLCLARRRGWRDVMPLLAMGGVTAVVVTNPFGLVWQIVRHSTLLVQICRDWYFLAGLTLAVAPLAAMGLDHCLRQSRRPRGNWLACLAIALLAGWSVRELIVGLPGRPGFPSGWGSAVEAAIALGLFALAIYVLPTQRGALRTCLAAVLLLTVGVDYKVFGTCKRFNAVSGRVDFKASSFNGMDDAVYRQLSSHPEFRVAMDQTGPFPGEIRLQGLRTPQGFDPLLTAPYTKLMGELGRFTSDREIDIDSANQPALRQLGVRYFITSEGGPQYPRLLKDPRFRLVEPSQSYYKVFELKDARPSYGWLAEDGTRSVRRLAWTPEFRAFVVRSDTGGQFALAEQFFPGWRVTLDGAPANVERWSDAFQAVRAPAGEHRIEFRFHSTGVRVGALVSLAAVLGLCLATLWPGRLNRST